MSAAADAASRRGALEATIRTYFDGCNEADAEKMISCMAPEAAHYFPAGSPFGVFRGADGIARGWQQCVASLDSRWTIDRVVVDVEANEAAIEWTHWKPAQKSFLRGAEWYRFDEDGKILEIRAYYASPTHPGVAAHELGDFDYAGRGYPLEPPRIAGRERS
jgi:ketosteroid isomerase-like protein